MGGLLNKPFFKGKKIRTRLAMLPIVPWILLLLFALFLYQTIYWLFIDAWKNYWRSIVMDEWLDNQQVYELFRMMRRTWACDVPTSPALSKSNQERK